MMQVVQVRPGTSHCWLTSHCYTAAHCVPLYRELARPSSSPPAGTTRSVPCDPLTPARCTPATYFARSWHQCRHLLGVRRCTTRRTRFRSTTTGSAAPRQPASMRSWPASSRLPAPHCPTSTRPPPRLAAPHRPLLTAGQAPLGSSSRRRQRRWAPAALTFHPFLRLQLGWVE